jgi:hypothetical protein
MTEATHQSTERDQADIPEREQVMDSVGDALTQSVNTFGRMTKAVVDGFTEVTVSSIGVFTDVAAGRSRGSARDRSEQQRAARGERRSSAGRMAQGWADLLTDTVEVVTDGMTRSARSVQRAADHFAGEAEKKSTPGTSDAEKDSSTARSAKKS